jgi:hypothetical protein
MVKFCKHLNIIYRGEAICNYEIVDSQTLK